jgi:hypothetical protein
MDTAYAAPAEHGEQYGEHSQLLQEEPRGGGVGEAEGDVEPTPHTMRDHGQALLEEHSQLVVSELHVAKASIGLTPARRQTDFLKMLEDAKAAWNQIFVTAIQQPLQVAAHNLALEFEEGGLKFSEQCRKWGHYDTALKQAISRIDEALRKDFRAVPSRVSLKRPRYEATEDVSPPGF